MVYVQFVLLATTQTLMVKTCSLLKIKLVVFTTKNHCKIYIGFIAQTMQARKKLIVASDMESGIPWNHLQLDKEAGSTTLQ